MPFRHALVTGANRGLGLAMARRLLAAGSHVVAACRHPGKATALNTLAGEHPGRLHVLDHKGPELSVRGPLNIASYLMGTTEFLTLMMMEPDKAELLLRKITDYLKAWLTLQRETFPSIDGIFMLDDVPSQQYTVRLDGEDHDLTFMFNQMADRWSFSAGISFGDCPKIGGRLVEPGLNLYAGVASDTLLIALDRPGISTTGVDWYARLTAPLGDGLPATMLVTGSVGAFNGLFRPRTAIAC